MSGADIIPPILPAPAHEDMFLEWRTPESEAGFRQLCRMRAHIVEQCVLSYAPRKWERLSKMDEANRARALAVSIDNACRGIDREIALYLANESHPAQLFRPDEDKWVQVGEALDAVRYGSVSLHSALAADMLSRGEVYARAGLEEAMNGATVLVSRLCQCGQHLVDEGRCPCGDHYK